MARIDTIPLDEMTPEQRRINDHIAGKRQSGVARGPFGIWLRMPALAEKAAAFGDHVRDELSIDRRLAELAILVVARHFTAQYEWFAHERHARRAGVADATIEAIRARREPRLADEAEEAVYALATELLRTQTVSDESYARARAALGEQGVIELTTTVGFYSMVAMMLVTFRVDVPEGADPLPEERGRGAHP